MSKEFDEKSKNLKIKDYDFDYMIKLYKEDPDEFEVISKKIIDDHINNIPDKFRRFKMQALQAKINCTLNGIKDPIARYLKMQELLYQSMQDFYNIIRPGLYNNDGKITIETLIDTAEKMKEEKTKESETTKNESNVVNMFKK